MRSLCLLIVTLLSVSGGVTATAAAQDATPGAQSAATSSPVRTDTRYVLPYFRGDLAPGLAATGNASGACTSPSLADIGRPDAWLCTDSADQAFYDPCFENPLVPEDGLGELACLDSPFSTEVVIFSLTEPLARQKRSGDGGSPAGAAGETPGRKQTADLPAGDDVMTIEEAAASDQALDDEQGTLANPLDVPWAVELANGERCTFQTGATAVLAGERVNYECSGGGFILGEVDRDLEVWTVSYVANDAAVSTLEEVTVAWT